jgi:nucleoside-diphosphate-sugar epimerase
MGVGKLVFAPILSGTSGSAINKGIWRGEKMEILVLGGTTFFGRRLVEKLLAAGHHVSIFTRGRHVSDFPGLSEHIAGDRKDYESFGRIFRHRHYDWVFDNIAFNAADVECLLKVFAGNIGHYLVCSSEAVYADRNSRLSLLREEEADLALVAGDPYGDGKRALERVLFEYPAAEQTFPFTILRPTVVEGPHDPTWRTWFWLQRLLDGGELLIPVTTPSMIGRFVFCDDVADAYLLAAGNRTAFNKVYNIAGENIFTLEDYLGLMAGMTGQNPVYAHATYDRIRREPGLAHFAAEYAGGRYLPDITKARLELGFKPRRIQEWLPVTLDWLIKTETKKDSNGYDGRSFEIVAARKILNLNGRHP